MTSTPYFFGYGSLVNRRTHNYPDAHHATLRGWRRAWVPSMRHDRVFLSVTTDAKTDIKGLIAAVPGADWTALDARETGYRRQSSGAAVDHPLALDTPVAHYAVHHSDTGIVQHPHILLSYLDVVVQGFLHEFGEQGVTDFFLTTSGWEIPVRDDRTKPVYPRHQMLTQKETALVDWHLDQLSARVEKGH
ncbi:MAG: gamma-glutamylcyclotransferase family protein [Pseudomonadota bacterium]